MRNSFTYKHTLTITLIIVIAMSSTGYSQKKPRKTLTEDAVKLEYNYPSDKMIKYLNISKIYQVMDVDGQPMQVNVSSDLGCSIRSVEKQGENLKLEIKIDSMAQSIDTPQGATGGAVKEVQGQVFNMILSPTGREIDISEAEKIVFIIEGSGESNASQSFIGYFPDLPAGPVKPGDTWVSNDTLSSKTQSMSIKMLVKSDNKFEGIEKTDGIECAKISATLNGTREIITQSQGMDIYTTGSFTGTEILLFAIKEGYFIKQTVTTKMTGSIEISGPQRMSFPLTADSVSTNEMIK